MHGYRRSLRNVARTLHIVVIPPNGHSTDENVRYCGTARRVGRFLISEQDQFRHLASGSSAVTASTQLMSLWEGLWSSS